MCSDIFSEYSLRILAEYFSIVTYYLSFTHLRYFYSYLVFFAKGLFSIGSPDAGESLPWGLNYLTGVPENRPDAITAHLGSLWYPALTPTLSFFVKLVERSLMQLALSFAELGNDCNWPRAVDLEAKRSKVCHGNFEGYEVFAIRQMGVLPWRYLQLMSAFGTLEIVWPDLKLWKLDINWLSPKNCHESSLYYFYLLLYYPFSSPKA